MKILLAEDLKSNQILLRAYIEKAGHEVVIVNDGQQAVDYFINERPDLVLMDIVMPVKDGIDAAKEIKELYEEDDDWVPIIFLSAMTEAYDIVRAINAGGDDYLTKPVDSVVLNAKLSAMQRISDMRHQLQDANDKLRIITLKDGLTGIANRRHFDDVLAKEIQRATRAETALSFIMCDIDSFKPYNDNYGHQAGDECLRAVAQIMEKTSNRSSDLVARYGGEEFGFILPATDEKGARSIAESIRRAVCSLGIVHNYSLAKEEYVTISSGIATIYPKKGEDKAELTHHLINTADKGLYLAKEQGRNRVAVVELD